MRTLLLYSLFVSLCSCSNKGEEKGNVHAIRPADPLLTSERPAEQLIHSIVAAEVIQVPNYTYILAREGNDEYWLAVPSMQVKKGDTLYYDNGVMMQQFESKELKRKFEKILFVDRIYTSKEAAENQSTASGLPKGHMPVGPSGKEKSDNIGQSVRIDPPDNGVSVADILKNPASFNGKKIVVKGRITKYTSGVMGKNWVHIQDGSSHNGKSEIVVTTLAKLAKGDIVTFEGLISLNKDLGYGYFFEVLMEDATVLR